MSTGTAAQAGAAPPSASGTSYGTPAYRLYVLLVLTLVYTLNFIDRNLLAVIAQPVIAAFHLSDGDYGFLNGPPFALFYAVMGIPIAMAADRYNRVIIIAICISLWSIMAATCGLATSFLFLLIARVGVAVGEAGGTPPSNSIIGDYFKPRSRANALAIFAMGVTIGGALSNFFGGPIVRTLNGPAVQKIFEGWGWDWAVRMADWQHIESWRIAFVLTGAPGLLVALILLFTVREPPRGYSDPAGTARPEKASILDTLREVAPKPTFWTMAMGASLTALVGYGLTGFQAPMAQRLHGIDPGTFAWDFGGPLALFSAAGTFTGGFLVDRLTPRYGATVSIVPAVGILLAIPLYIFAYYQPTESVYSIARPIWCIGAFCHYSYIGSQYTIGQGVVSQRGRASSIAILLLLIALIGNGLGPLITGALSDMFMSSELKAHTTNPALTLDLCRNAALVAKLAANDAAVCKAAYGEGLRQSMTATALIFIPAAVFFLLSALTLKKDLVARPV